MLVQAPLRRSALLALVLTAVGSVPAHGGVPSTTNSFHDACFTACPLGDIVYHVTVRDLANNPVPSSFVVLDFSQCGFIHCANPGAGITVNEATHQMQTFTNAAGVASFPLAMGGCCPSVNIIADGVPLGTVAMKSPDADASLTVNALDAGIVASGSSLPYSVCNDLDCNGVVDAADVGFVNLHLTHACPVVVPAQRQSWGTLKTHYR